MTVEIQIHKIPGRSNKARGRSMAKVVAVALVDDDKGHLADEFWTLGRDGYARTSRAGRTWLMQHAVIGRHNGADVSHLNANSLDNRRDNLRRATRSENMLNTADPINRANTSGFRGVTRDDRNRISKLSRPWRGKVTIQGKTHQTRRFTTPLEAAIALNNLRRDLGVPEDLRVQEFPNA